MNGGSSLDFRTLAIAVGTIVITDVALQLDNAVAISSVASQLPANQRFAVLAAGVLLAAVCLFGFTLIGSHMIEHFGWLQPIAGGVLVIIGIRLVVDFVRA
jgi:predicted tellurium resistance membrane protein TerC